MIGHKPRKEAHEKEVHELVESKKRHREVHVAYSCRNIYHVDKYRHHRVKHIDNMPVIAAMTDAVAPMTEMIKILVL